ncbi:MAG: DUF308 domain-containing protein [Bacteroidales bacterium]|nr:DUF308 domain-containing protein [Bacteroidales bacterium]
MLKSTKTSYLVRALVFLALALMCFCVPQGTLKSIAWIAGLAIILAGVATFFSSRHKVEGQTNVLLIVAACAMALVGLLIIIYPHIIAMLIGVFILFEGVEFIVAAVRSHKAKVSYWGWILAVGIVVTLLGGLTIFSEQWGAAVVSIAMGVGFLGISLASLLAMTTISKVEQFFKTVHSVIEQRTPEEQEFTDVEVLQ